MRLASLIDRIVFSKSALRDIDLRLRIELCKGQNPAAVVIMAVAEDNRVHLGQIDAKLLCVRDQKVRLTGVHEELMVLRLDVKAQAVLRSAACLSFRVFNKVYYAHVSLPRSAFTQMSYGSGVSDPDLRFGDQVPLLCIHALGIRYPCSAFTL